MEYYGQIHRVYWDTSLFRLGHVQEQIVKLPEGIGCCPETKSHGQISDFREHVEHVRDLGKTKKK